MTLKDKIIETAKNVLIKNPNGMQLTSLKEAVISQHPDLNPGTVEGYLVTWKNHENDYLKSLGLGVLRWPPPEPEEPTPKFTWVPIYRQIAEKVLDFRDRQGELIAIFKNLREMNINPIPLEDKVGANETVPLTEIDPFTIFASFNVSGRGKESRHRTIIEEIQKALGLVIREPEDFSGINTINSNHTWFFGDKYKGRSNDDIPLLWGLAEAVLQKQDDRIAELFPKCLGIRRIAGPKLSTGLTWLDPENYVALSEKTISYFNQEFSLAFSPKIWFKCRNSTKQEREIAWRDYMEFIAQLRKRTNDPFYKIAHIAYSTDLDKTEPTVEEYANAIQILLDKGKISNNIKTCLAALYEDPLTMAQMSKLIGSDSDKGARLPMGDQFGKSLYDVLREKNPLISGKASRVFASCKRDPQQNNAVVHTLRPNFRKALEQFLLVDWKLPPDTSEKPSVSPRDAELFSRIDDILKDKKQVILFGPPGTGKTFQADGYVTFKTGSRENERIVRCTFHPEYGYEHFIEGFKPKVENGQMVFERKDGVFKELCEKAAKNRPQPFYLIIDEINRGDIPRIFGELITLVEADKRGRSKAKLPHSGEDFTVPDNVYIIATMNTADRSIALLDTALRRRFGFIEMIPDYTVLGNQKINNEIHLGEWLRGLNENLVKELQGIRNDAKHVRIGHSYLMPGGKVVESRKQLERIIDFEILPLLEEYCYEASDIYERLKEYIKKSLNLPMPSQNITPKQETPLEVSTEPPTVDDVE